VPAARALEIGLVNRVVPPGEHQAAARALAVEVLERASSQSIALTKRLLLDVLGRPLDDALDRAAEVNAAARATDDCKHGIAHFLEHKKPPTWR
jgi:methylglutaconyl-CoA hydratase